MSRVRPSVLPVLVVSLSLSMVACTTSTSRAPITDAGSASGRVGSMAPRVDPSTLPNWEYRGQPGYYSVKPGDTLTRIASSHGVPVRDLIAWNGLANPNVIEVEQVLRVTPPAGGQAPTPIAVNGSSGSQSASVPPPPIQSRPLGSNTAPPQAADSEGATLNWMWPATGQVITKFDGKGIDIAGNAGDPVFASADGRVVYAGSGLRGYGNVIIIKHSDTFITAYGHNRALLVKENENVKRGQKVAEMGSSDADRVKLHFEVRRQGKPVDPSRYLPAR